VIRVIFFILPLLYLLIVIPVSANELREQKDLDEVDELFQVIERKQKEEWRKTKDLAEKGDPKAQYTLWMDIVEIQFYWLE